MKKILVLIILFSFNTIYSQRTSYPFSLSDSIRKYFNYDTLRNFSCKETPAGVYIISFKIDKQNKVYDYKFSDNSLVLLKNLFESALNLSLSNNHTLNFDKDYLQQVYYNSYSFCIYQQDTILKKSTSIDKEVSEILNDQLMAIENSFNRIFLDEKSPVIVLNPVVINNVNPNRSVPKKGFYNDHQKKDIKELPDDKLKMIIDEIQKRKSTTSSSG